MTITTTTFKFFSFGLILYMKVYFYGIIQAVFTAEHVQLYGPYGPVLICRYTFYWHYQENAASKRTGTRPPSPVYVPKSDLSPGTVQTDLNRPPECPDHLHSFALLGDALTRQQLLYLVRKVLRQRNFCGLGTGLYILSRGAEMINNQNCWNISKESK